MPSPRISFVTPTRDRPLLLPMVYRWLTAMPEVDWEWVVLDDSATPCPFMVSLTDPRARYLRVAPGLSFGAKRNEIVAAARGRYIVHIDDDDYYGPGHPAALIAALEAGAGLAKLGSWMVSGRRGDVLGWVDMTRRPGLGWEFSGDEVRRVRSSGAASSEGATVPEVEVVTPETGWGFSFAFRRETWLACPFPDINWNDDGLFASAVAERFGLAQVPGVPRRCLHTVHAGSSSACFPYRLLPGRALHRLYPPAVRELVAVTGGLSRQPAPER